MGAKGNNGRLALVLSGGHALGAFQAGAFEALEAGGATRWARRCGGATS
jgi:predicted acylesterase/phospholipase RssA